MMLNKISCKISRGLVAAAATALGLVGAMWAVVGQAMVPFSATFKGTAQFTGPNTAAFQGSGIARHMGASTNSGAIVIVGGPDENNCLPNVNTEILTGANGDQLVIEMHDLACPVAPPLPIFHGVGHWSVIGGTGRFAGATGSGTVDGMGDFLNGFFEITIVGYIEGIRGN